MKSLPWDGFDRSVPCELWKFTCLTLDLVDVPCVTYVRFDVPFGDLSLATAFLFDCLPPWLSGLWHLWGVWHHFLLNPLHSRNVMTLPDASMWLCWVKDCSEQNFTGLHHFKWIQNLHRFFSENGFHCISREKAEAHGRQERSEPQAPAGWHIALFVVLVAFVLFI